ncbi:hypothetical protein TNCV_682291 [Trichonephila clavipes]|nr:hypothetical protein TNCV_682291 [Trichonephila clavipes]
MDEQLKTMLEGIEGRKVRSGYLPFRTSPISRCVTYWVASFVCDGLRHHLCETALKSNGLFALMFDGLVAFAVDIWRHNSDARSMRFKSRPGSPMKKGRFVLGTFRSEKNTSTLPITPRLSYSRDFGSKSHKYHTTTVSMP